MKCLWKNEMIDKTLAHYTIIEKLGAGGMGEVYRAEDTKLERHVALKILPDVFASDPERMARFEREAKLLASLNHPNIAAIFGLEEADGKHFLVMELIEGETLYQRLVQGALSIEDTLDVCRQIAEAVEAAHEKGIIHRDLKPANVKITPEGRVKVLDFGLAKALFEDEITPDLSKSPTLTAQMTQPGVILGTAAYMSPEQTKGKAVDKRSDIWAFGCILFECLTGKRAFKGETISEIVASILKDEPDWNKLAKDTPNSLRRLLNRCLNKDLRLRLQHIGDARLEILESLEIEPDIHETATRRFSLKRLGILAVLFISGVILTALFFILVRGEKNTVPSDSLYFSGILPEGLEITTAFSPPLVISPDGTQLLIQSGSWTSMDRQLLLLNLQSDFNPVPLEGAKGPNIHAPFFSTDGDSIGFVNGTALYWLKLSTGVTTKICDLPTKLLAGATCSSNNTIVIATAGTGLLCIGPGNDKPKTVTNLNSEEGVFGHWLPDFHPNGRHIVFTKKISGDEKPAVLDLETGQIHSIGNLPRANCARFLPPNKLVYTDAGDLFVVTLDLETWIAVGEPMKMISGVYTWSDSGLPYFSVSHTGSIVYSPGDITQSQRNLVFIDHEGIATPLTDLERAYIDPRFSPDGTKVAVTATTPGALGDIYVYDVSSGRETRLSTDRRAFWPRWTPDGRRVTYGSGYGTIAWKPVLEEAEEEIILRGKNPMPSSWHINGDVLIFEQFVAGRGSDIYELSLGGEPKVIVGSEADERFARLSPDGKWLAYSSNETGQFEVYIRPYPSNQRGQPVTVDGGDQPVWSSDGRRIYYLNANRLMVVPVNLSPELEIGNPKEILVDLFLTQANLQSYSTHYDVSPDEKYFVMLQGGEKIFTSRYNFILNWSQEVERRLKNTK